MEGSGLDMMETERHARLEKRRQVINHSGLVATPLYDWLTFLR
jgi:hypothetical protein